MECSKKLLIATGLGSAICVLLSALGVLDTEITLAVLGLMATVSAFYLWKAKNENRSKYAIKYIEKLPKTYTAEEKARFLEIVLKD